MCNVNFTVELNNHYNPRQTNQQSKNKQKKNKIKYMETTME